MFKDSADNVRSRLKEMLKHAESLLGDKTDDVFVQIKRDYRSIIGNGDMDQEGQILPREQRLARKEVMRVIEGVEKAFVKVAGLKTGEQGIKSESKDATPHSDGEVEEATAENSKEESLDAHSEKEDSPLNQLVGDGHTSPATPRSESAAYVNDEMTDDASDSGSE